MTRYYESNLEAYNNEKYTKFHAIADKPRRVITHEDEVFGDFPFAELTVQNPKERTLFDNSFYDLDVDQAEQSARTLGSRMRWAGHDEDEIEKAVEEQTNTPQMFYSEPAEVVGLYADPSLRHTVGTLSGLALNQFGKLRVDEFLSKYSSRLAKRGIDAGVVEANPHNISAKTNIDTDLSPREWGYNVESTTNPTLVPPTSHSEISKPRLDHARRTIHGIIRPKTSSEQFGPLQPDPQLPGMEDY